MKTAKLWVRQAEENLKWAESSFNGGFFTQTCFIAQQVIETALKGFLRSKGKKIIGPLKTHNLILLLKKSAEYDKDFQIWREACEKITDYYTPTRYPEVLTFSTYTKKTAKEALTITREILKFINSKLE